MIADCCDERRTRSLEGSGLNGLDYIEVLDRDAPTPAERQRTLFVHFVNAPAPALLSSSLRIEGGERVRGIRVIGVTPHPGDARILDVRVDQPGDFSRYTLRLVRDEEHPEPPPGIDPVLAAMEFGFKVECPSEFDCRPGCPCRAAHEQSPEIDYLARDYAAFRRLMLDRMAVLAPAWRERSPADLGIALLELLAYVADHLSYEQDAVSTEAYLGTARRRVSVRRHARLVDYTMHDGCNARTWVQLGVSTNVTKAAPDSPPPIPRGTPLCTSLAGAGTLVTAADLERADAVFETMEDVEALHVDHGRMPFHAWGDQECCLPREATQATLRGHLPNLRGAAPDGTAGEVLIFEEVRGPLTGAEGDADPEQRHAVRLVSVRAFDDDGDPLTDPLSGEQITQVEWLEEDALPAPICLSSRADAAHGGQLVTDVSVARGNLVLVDHGATHAGEDLGQVPEARLFYAAPDGSCRPADREPLPPRYRPVLRHGPLTQVGALPHGAPASRSLLADPPRAVPAITLASTLGTAERAWQPRLDLLDDEPDDAVFVAEVEADGLATVRFGDDRHGHRPDAGTHFAATYRVGNGTSGNVGRDAISHVVSTEAAITAVRNPLPARGGVDPESMEDVRQRAPTAFRTQERAVTEHDYAEVTERLPGIQRAAASFRWTGSWHTVFLTIDRLAGRQVDAELERHVRESVERYRMAGHDLEVDAPRFVSLEIALDICVKADYFRSGVKSALLDVFSSRTLADGRRGLFHPDAFSFGQTVYLSPIVAEAQAVEGVESVEVVAFGRQGDSDPGALAAAELRLGRLEIARLENDPSFPEHGVLRIDVRGGK